MLECVGQALGEMLRKERRQAKRELADEIKSLRVELGSSTRFALAELRQTIAASSPAAEVIDLVPVSRRN